MNHNLHTCRAVPGKCRITSQNASLYRAAIPLVSFTWGGAVWAQSTNAPSAAASSDTGSGTNVVKLAPTTVVGNLDVAREQIMPDLGATAYGINQEQIQTIPAGEDASINQVLLRAPGVAQDSAVNSGFHLRGEHANVQYRINDVLLPEGITGFGAELSPRFVDTMSLITGSLPAQYGFRTAGIVDIHTKSGAFEPGGELSLYGGSRATIIPAFEYGGSQGNFSYFASGSYNHNDIGIENPTSSWYLKRGAVAMFEIGMNLPEDCIYPDTGASPLDGHNYYVVHFAKGALPPVDEFWSVTVYDMHGFTVPNPTDRYTLGDRSNLKPNADASLDIYLQNESPGAEKESNCLPVPAQPFSLHARLYSPRAAAIDGTWAMPPVVRVK